MSNGLYKIGFRQRLETKYVMQKLWQLHVMVLSKFMLPILIDGD